MSDEAVNKSDIDDLLSGVDPIRSSIEIPVNPVEDEPPPTSQTDPALAPATPQSAKIDSYPLGAEPAAPTDQMPALELSVARFVNLYGPLLRTIALRPIEITSNPLKVLRYSEFLEQQTQPSYTGIVSLTPLQGEGLLCFSSTLLSLIVDYLYGGQGRLAMTEQDRGCSASVRKIADRLLNAMCSSFSQAVQGLVSIEMNLLRQEVELSLVRLVQPNDYVLLVGLNALLGEESHAINLCLPYLAVEPIRRKLQETKHSEGPLNHRRWMDLLLDQVKIAEVELVADLATAQSSMADLARFKVGDFIELNLQKSLIARIADVPVLTCGYGLSNGHYAIRVHDFMMTNDSSEKMPHHVQ